MQRLRAFCLIRQQPVYRHDAFEAGLAAAGFQVQHGWPIYPILPGEVFCIWNRYAEIEVAADKFEAAGGTVLVAENGYLGVDRADRKIYALAKGKHNGGGSWPHDRACCGEDAEELYSRFNEQAERSQILLAAMRRSGEHILVAPNRSFGTRGNIMPLNWADDVARRLRAVTKRPIRVRPHPGNYDSGVPLEKDLENAWAVVIWSSSVGVEALRRGIYVISEANWWICKSAAYADIAKVEQLVNDNGMARYDAMARLCWAQWTVDEIQSGLPFKLLCTSTAPATSTA